MKIKTSLVFLCLILIMCNPSERTKALIKTSNELFGVIPDKMPGSENDTLPMINLGRKLFFDTRLSI